VLEAKFRMSGRRINLVFMLLALSRTTTDHVLVEGNMVSRNNRPNPVPPDSGEELCLVPTGSGILDIADDVTFRRNVVVGNGTVGIAVVASPFAGLDPRVEPSRRPHTRGRQRVAPERVAPRSAPSRRPCSRHHVRRLRKRDLLCRNVFRTDRAVPRI
jgi:hypothetical protein